MSNKRSKASRQKKKQKQQEQKQYLSDRTIANNILLRYSWRDKLIGEAVFTNLPCATVDGEPLTFKTLIRKKLKEQFGDGYPVEALNHEYGEVLNRFKLKAPPTYTYTSFKGAFQHHNSSLKHKRQEGGEN